MVPHSKDVGQRGYPRMSPMAFADEIKPRLPEGRVHRRSQNAKIPRLQISSNATGCHRGRFRMAYTGGTVPPVLRYFEITENGPLFKITKEPKSQTQVPDIPA